MALTVEESVERNRVLGLVVGLAAASYPAFVVFSAAQSALEGRMHPAAAEALAGLSFLAIAGTGEVLGEMAGRRFDSGVNWVSSNTAAAVRKLIIRS